MGVSSPRGTAMVMLIGVSVGVGWGVTVDGRVSVGTAARVCVDVERGKGKVWVPL